MLVARAHRAAIEETAHAQILGRLARRHGAEPFPFFSRPYAIRDAFELALDNAVEGCVNETYGALVLHAQALNAEDAVTRAAFASIAEEEASHAELSADLDDWLDTRLSHAERRSTRDQRSITKTSSDGSDCRTRR